MLEPAEMLRIFLAGMFTPAILFFFFGIASVLVKSDIEVPPAVRTGLAIFLLASIGMQGGVEAIQALVMHPELIGVIVIIAIIAVTLGVFWAICTGNIFKKFVGLNTADAWATGGHYAAVSSATLFIAVAVASAAQDATPEASIFAGWMAAMYPFMDSPALLTAIVFGRMALAREGIGRKLTPADRKKVIHDTVFGMAVWLLVSSLIIGALAQIFSPAETERAMVFFDDMFYGVLCLFLIDMGIFAGKQLGALKELGRKFHKALLVVWVWPQVQGVAAILAVYGVHLMFPGTIGWGDALVFAAVSGSASFITAPVAMRAAIPEANPSIYLSLPVALTFPFNIMIGIPFWQIIAMTLWGAV